MRKGIPRKGKSFENSTEVRESVALSETSKFPEQRLLREEKWDSRQDHRGFYMQCNCTFLKAQLLVQGFENESDMK